MGESQLFIDMDGVLADFDAHHEAVFGFRSDKIADNVDWKKVAAVGNFYRDIPPMKDFDDLWAFVSPMKPIILTGVPSSVMDASWNKRQWVDRVIGKDQPMIPCRSKEKSKHCKPGDVLIDDWEKYRSLWVAAGGCWITHVSAAKSIALLQDYLRTHTPIAKDCQ